MAASKCAVTMKLADWPRGWASAPPKLRIGSEEYLRLCIAIRVVPSIEDAIAHINRYSTKNSEAIVTNDEAQARLFLRLVDSAVVYWNASTRFSDGGEFGFGAEMGISTQKLHCRGPFALAELTSAKYEVTGSGQVEVLICCRPDTPLHPHLDEVNDVVAGRRHGA